MSIRAVCALSVALLACANTAAPPPPAPTSTPPPVALSAAKPPVAPVVAPSPPYELAPGSARVVRTLPEPMEIDVYVKRGTPALDEYARGLTALVQAYARVSEGKLKTRVIEPATMAEAETARAAGINERQFDARDVLGRKVATTGFLGVSFRYRGTAGVIPELHLESSDGGIEFWMTNKIREIRDLAEGTKRRVGVLASKGELKLSDANLTAAGGPKAPPSLQGIVSQAFPHYSIEEVDLHGGTQAVDTGLSGLIVTQPQKDYSERELRRIDEFLMQGKKGLAVFASAVNVAPSNAKMPATLSTHGLESLLAGYGVVMAKDVVLDFGAQFRHRALPDFSYPPIPFVSNDPQQGPAAAAFDSDFPPFFRMEDLVFPFASSLTFNRDAQPPEVAMRPVAATSPATTFSKTSPFSLSPATEWKNKPPIERHIVAATVEGKLRSAFRGPLRAAGAPEQAKDPSRVLVISSSLFLTNPFAYAANPPATPEPRPKGKDPLLLGLAQEYTSRHLTGVILVFKNTLDWLAGDDDLVTLSARIARRRRRTNGN